MNEGTVMSASAEQSAAGQVAEEDRLRADLYNYLGTMLAGPPDQSLLSQTAGLSGDDGLLGQGVTALAKVAALTKPEAAEREFNKLFIGLGRGELLPYASYYLTGFLNEKPLATLRRDMAARGLRRAENVYEPEDNIASLMEMMAALIVGPVRRSGTAGGSEDVLQPPHRPLGAAFLCRSGGRQELGALRGAGPGRARVHGDRNGSFPHERRRIENCCRVPPGARRFNAERSADHRRATALTRARGGHSHGEEERGGRNQEIRPPRFSQTGRNKRPRSRGGRRDRRGSAAEAAEPDLTSEKMQDTAHTRAYFDSARF